jgi:uncharacterized protein YggE
MSRRSLWLAPMLAMLLAAAPAVADQSKSVTATGTGTVKVTPTNRQSNASIKAAVEAARKTAIKPAIDNAREHALLYAQAAGLALGPVISVSDVQSNGFAYYGGPFFGPFGPDQYCGFIRRTTVKIVAGKKKIVPGKRVRRCFVPAFESTTLTITYSAT